MKLNSSLKWGTSILDKEISKMHWSSKNGGEWELRKFHSRDGGSLNLIPSFSFNLQLKCSGRDEHI